MLIYSVAGGKGGTGKSTISVSLAASHAEQGKQVAIVDLDTLQETVDSIYQLKLQNVAIFTSLGEHLNGFDVVILDYPPAQEKPVITDNVVIVLEPDNISEKALLHWQGQLKDKNAIYVFNRVDNRIYDEKQQAKNLAQKYNGMIVSKRQIFRRASNESKTVFQMANKFGAREARKDINLLRDRINEQFS